jgi:L-lysine exporter family protein LysE/ArgO
MFINEFFWPFLKGFLLMASVIFAVGPQNAMLLRHGLRREHPFLIASIFTICDCLLISLGVFGVGQFVVKILWLKYVIVYGGAAFLLWFAMKAFRAAWRGGHSMDNAGDITMKGTLIATAFAVSLLNPGAIIDTVVIIGSVSSKYPLPSAIAFGLGAQAFSAAFFFALAGFSKSLAPKLRNPNVWRIIDAVVGLITVWIGLHLLFFDF